MLPWNGGLTDVTSSGATQWDPDQYERFKAERTRPFWDLLALVQPVPGGRVVDLGCGTGELTKELHRVLEASETVGIDSSPSTRVSRSRTWRGLATPIVSPSEIW